MYLIDKSDQVRLSLPVFLGPWQAPEEVTGSTSKMHVIDRGPYPAGIECRVDMYYGVLTGRFHTTIGRHWGQ